jgi:hypothetical protein
MDTLEYLLRSAEVEQADEKPVCLRCGGTGMTTVPVVGLGGEIIPGIRQPQACPCTPVEGGQEIRIRVIHENAV